VAACSVAGCIRPLLAKGLCNLHYKRVRRGVGIQGITPERRFFSRIARETPGGCWEWDRPRKDGYGQFAAGNNRVSVPAHRWSYEFLVGPVPDGLDLDHLCRNRRCVNPDHLDPVPNAENILRGTSPSASNARKTECEHGHALDTGNTYITPDGRRQCRACRSAASTKYQMRRARQRAAA
jgi:hypothetical protein